MATRLVTRTLAAVTGLGIALGAGVVPADAAAGRATVRFHATAKHNVKGPDTLRPGRVHLHNSGKRPIMIIRAHARDRDAVAKGYNAKSNRKARAALKRYKVVEFLMPRADDVVLLRRGSYLLVDASMNHLKAEKFRVLHARGARVDGRNPGTARLGTGKDFAMAGSSTMRSSSWTTFVNHSDGLVFFEFMRVSRSASESDVRDVIAHPTNDKIFKLWDTKVFEIPVIVGEHQSVTHRMTLPTGRYFVHVFSLTHPAHKLHTGDVKLVTVG